MKVCAVVFALAVVLAAGAHAMVNHGTHNNAGSGTVVGVAGHEQGGELNPSGHVADPNTIANNPEGAQGALDYTAAIGEAPQESNIMKLAGSLCKDAKPSAGRVGRFFNNIRNKISHVCKTGASVLSKMLQQYKAGGASPVEVAMIERREALGKRFKQPNCSPNVDPNGGGDDPSSMESCVQETAESSPAAPQAEAEQQTPGEPAHDPNEPVTDDGKVDEGNPIHHNNGITEPTNNVAGGTGEAEAEATHVAGGTGGTGAGAGGKPVDANNPVDTTEKPLDTASSFVDLGTGPIQKIEVHVRAFIGAVGSAALAGASNKMTCKLGSQWPAYGVPAAERGHTLCGKVLGWYETGELFNSNNRDFSVNPADHDHSKTSFKITLQKSGNRWTETHAQKSSTTAHYIKGILPHRSAGKECSITNVMSDPLVRGRLTTNNARNAKWRIEVREGNPCAPGAYTFGPIMHELDFEVNLNAAGTGGTFKVSGKKSRFPALEINMRVNDSPTWNYWRWGVRGRSVFALMLPMNRITPISHTF